MRSHNRSVAKFALLRPLPYLRPQGSALGCSLRDTQNPRALTSWGSPPYQISAELLGLQTPKVVPSPSLLPPPTIPRFLAGTSWQSCLASVHPLGPWVLLRTTVVTVQPACQSPMCCLTRAPMAHLVHSSQAGINLVLLLGSQGEPALPKPHPICPPTNPPTSAPSAFSSLTALRHSDHPGSFLNSYHSHGFPLLVDFAPSDPCA